MERALNNKSEWGGKVCGLMVTSPKGTGGKGSKERIQVQEAEVAWIQTVGSRRQERVKYSGDDTVGEDTLETALEPQKNLPEQRPGKIRRMSGLPARESQGEKKETFL